MTEIERTPPQDLDAEQAVIGCCLLEATTADAIVASVATSDFYREAHRNIFDAIRTIHNAGSPVDIITVAAELRRKKQLESVGGGEYLTAIIGEVPTSAHAMRYVEIVKRAAVCREGITLAADTMRKLYEYPDDPATVIADAGSGLQTLQEKACRNGHPRPIGDYAEESIARIEARKYRDYEVGVTRFGIPDLDQTTGGLDDAGYCIVQGGTNAGKTSLLIQIVLATAFAIKASRKKKQRILVAGLEESADKWWLRMASWIAQFDSYDVRNRKAWERKVAQDPGVEQRYIDALEVIRTLPIEYCEGNQNIASIEAYCRSTAKRHDIVLVVVDWLQRIEKEWESTGTEEQAFRELSGRLVRIQQELNCPLIGSSQVTMGADGVPYSFGAKAFDQTASTIVHIDRRRDKVTNVWPAEAFLVAMKSRDFASFGRFGVRTDFSTGRWTALTPEEVAETAAANEPKKGRGGALNRNRSFNPQKHDN